MTIVAGSATSAVLPQPRHGDRLVTRELASNATLVGRERLTDDIHLLHVLPDDGPVRFRAGQYLSVGIRRAGSWVLRPYSPANCPSAEGELELLVRRVPGGALTPLLWKEPVGARLHLGTPKGIFRLIPDDRRSHVFLATGTGIAPIVSMVGELVASGASPTIVIVHGVRHAAELAFRDRIQGWIDAAAPIAYLPAASGADKDAGGVAAGRATDLLPDLWDRLCLDPATAVAYLCGNPAVVGAAARFLGQTRGVPADAIRREEYWPGAGTASAASGSPAVAAMPGP